MHSTKMTTSTSQIVRAASSLGRTHGVTWSRPGHQMSNSAWGLSRRGFQSRLTVPLVARAQTLRPYSFRPHNALGSGPQQFVGGVGVLGGRWQGAGAAGGVR